MEVGRITKAFGLKGEVLVALSSDRASRLDPGSVLETERGPLVVVSASPHQNRFIVQFEGVSDRQAAEVWRGTLLRAAPPAGDDVDDLDALWVHELIGASVVTPDGATLGTVTEVQANPAADLLVLDGGALIPMNFVRDHEPGRISVEIPDGLLEL